MKTVIVTKRYLLQRHTPEGTQASPEMLGLARISGHHSETHKAQCPLKEVVQPEGTPQHQNIATVVVG
jgi:hypothetical protein